MNYQIDNNTLKAQINWTQDFKNPIKKVLEFNKVLVVLLEREIGTNFYQNIFGVNKSNGNLAWQIENLEQIKYEDEYYEGIIKPYVDIIEIDIFKIKAINWDGSQVELDVNTGKVLKNLIESRKNKRPW